MWKASVPEKLDARGLNRRDFLKLGGTGLVGASLLGVSGCGVFSGSEGGGGTGGGAKTLNVNISTEIPDLNTSTTTDAVSTEILLAINEGLYRLDENTEPQPAQAESVEISDDQLTYTFTLRDGIQWSNGDPVTAEDFRYAWLKALDPETASQYAYIIGQFVEGGTEYNSGDGSADDVAVEAVDDKTLRVTLVAPAPYFLGLTGFWTYYPQSQAYVEEQGEDYAQGADTLLFNGPFTMVEGGVGAGGTTVLEKNPDYWDSDNVDIERINMRVVKDVDTALNLYESGELDVTRLVAEQVERYQDDPQFQRNIEYTCFYGQMNQEYPPFANVNIRKAFMTGFDRTALADTILADGSVPALAIVPPEMPGPEGETFREANGDLIDPDPSQAREFWDRGVEELGEEPEISILAGDTSIDRDITTFLQAQYEENLGYRPEIEIVNFEAGLDRVDNLDYQISFVSGWGADYNDAMTFLELFTSDSSFNRAAWTSDEYDQIIADAKTETDQAARMEMMLEAEQILFDEAVIVPEYFRSTVRLQKPYLDGYVSAPYGANPEWKFATLEGKEA